MIASLWKHVGGVVWGILVLLAIAMALRLTVLQPPLVSVAEVARADVADEIEGTGTVTADVLVNIASKITGRVEQVFVDEGDTVRKGQIVATLDQTDQRRQVDIARAQLEQAKAAASAASAQLAQAEATAQEQQREWTRERGLVRPGAVSVEDWQQHEERLAVARSAVQTDAAQLGVARSAVQASAAKAADAEYNLSLAQIPSLFTGIVTKRHVVPGASVVPGQPMFTVADTRLIYVKAYVDQNFTGSLRAGDPATVILRGRENHPLHGRVLRISPQADAATEETAAEVAFTIPPGEFELDQWANVYIQSGMAKDALVVPSAAIMTVDNQKFVFVVAANGVLRRVPVTVLAQSPRRPIVAVTGNLRPHERIVLMPMGLKPGEAVRARPASKASTMAAGA